MGFPDVEVLVITYLTGRFTSAKVVTDLPANLDQVLPVIQVGRISGADSDYRLDHPIVDVDVYAADRAAASALAGQVRDALRLDLRTVDSVQPTGVVTDVQTIAGPRWLPDPNINLRRFSATYEVVLHS